MLHSVGLAFSLDPHEEVTVLTNWSRIKTYHNSADSRQENELMGQSLQLTGGG